LDHEGKQKSLCSLHQRIILFCGALQQLPQSAQQRLTLRKKNANARQKARLKAIEEAEERRKMERAENGKMGETDLGDTGEQRASSKSASCSQWDKIAREEEEGELIV
jgi:hypothetical protein